MLLSVSESESKDETKTTNFLSCFFLSSELLKLIWYSAFGSRRARRISILPYYISEEIQNRMMQVYLFCGTEQGIGYKAHITFCSACAPSNINLHQSRRPAVCSHRDRGFRISPVGFWWVAVFRSSSRCTCSGCRCFRSSKCIWWRSCRTGKELVRV